MSSVTQSNIPNEYSESISELWKSIADIEKVINSGTPEDQEVFYRLFSKIKSELNNLARQLDADDHFNR